MEAGWQATLFSATSAAAVTWAIMKPEFRPASGARNGGNPENAVLVSFSIRRSLMEASSASAMARKSAANAMG